MLQLHLSYQQFYCLLRCDLYKRFYGSLHFPYDIFQWILLNERFCIFMLKLVPESPVDNASIMIQVLVWCQASDKPLPEPMMTLFTDAYMCFYVSVCKLIVVQSCHNTMLRFPPKYSAHRCAMECLFGIPNMILNQCNEIDLEFRLVYGYTCRNLLEENACLKDLS